MEKPYFRNGQQLKVSLTPKKIFILWAVFLLALLVFYFVNYGLSALSLNFTEDYWLFRRNIRIRSKHFNIFTELMKGFIFYYPDKSSSLLGLLGSFILTVLAWIKAKEYTSNQLTRLLSLFGILLLIPLGFNLFVSLCILIFLLLLPLIIGMLLYFLYQWIMKGNTR
ncbi:MAG: hypothetical protein HC913_10560 [Microscillaceae bacterium]|nr:hypothetical protein [Microscillaceae bacterium]